MQVRHKKRLIITLQLKNAEVYPGSNLHGTVILQLMHKHNSSRHRTNSIESVDLTPNPANNNNNKDNNNNNIHSYPSSPKAIGPNVTIIDNVSISVSGICNINSSTDITHFPLHLKQESDTFNILRGKENILGRALQLKQQSQIQGISGGQYHDDTESIQFDFVVQLPPVLPCSYSGYFIQYLYYAQLFVTISKHVNRTKCRVPFYVLPLSSSNDTIPNLLTPMNLQERMSIFRKRKKSTSSHHHQSHNQHRNHPKLSLQSASSSSSVSSYPQSPMTPNINGMGTPNIDNNIYKPSPSLLLPASDSHFIENNILSTTHSNLEKLEEKDNISSYLFNNINDKNSSDDYKNNKYYYLRRNSLSLNYRDSNNLNNDDYDNNQIKNGIYSSSHSIHHHNNNKFKISLDNKCIGTLLLNDTIFCDGECIEGYLSLYTPSIVKVTLIHIENCGKKQKHLTNCCSSYQCCWDLPSFTFTLKIPNNAFKSFKSDLCQSSWSLHFEFAISKYLLTQQQDTSKPNTMGYLNTSYDIWSLHEQNNNYNNKNEKQQQNQCDKRQIDKILKWQLPIIVTTIHNPLRCVTRSNAVVVKC